MTDSLQNTYHGISRGVWVWVTMKHVAYLLRCVWATRVLCRVYYTIPGYQAEQLGSCLEGVGRVWCVWGIKQPNK